MRILPLLLVVVACNAKSNPDDLTLEVERLDEHPRSTMKPTSKAMPRLIECLHTVGYELRDFEQLRDALQPR